MLPLKIVISLNQHSIKIHMARAGWPPVFERGKPRVNNLEGEELTKGTVFGPVEADIHQMRSIDILAELAEGEEFDVALVGSDCIEERFNPLFLELGRYDYGRLLGEPRPRLELVTLANSTITTVKDIPPGAIILTERPRVTVIALEEQGVANLLVEDPYVNNPLRFREELINTGKIGIRNIEGAGPAHLTSTNPDRKLLVMVSETGKTLESNNLRVVSKLRDIDTVLLTNQDAYGSEPKRELIWQFAWDMNEAYESIKREYEGRYGLEREPI